MAQARERREWTAAGCLRTAAGQLHSAKSGWQRRGRAVEPAAARGDRSAPAAGRARRATASGRTRTIRRPSGRARSASSASAWSSAVARPSRRAWRAAGTPAGDAAARGDARRADPPPPPRADRRAPRAGNLKGGSGKWAGGRAVSVGRSEEAVSYTGFTSVEDHDAPRHGGPR